MGPYPHLLARIGDDAAHLFRARCGVEPLQLYEAELDAAPDADLFCPFPYAFLYPVAHGDVYVAQVGREVHPAGDDVDAARLRLYPSHRPYGRWCGGGFFLHDAHYLRRGGQRVVPPVHRRGPRVPRLAPEREPQPHGSGDARNDAHRQAFGLQYPPLLYVQLQVGRQGILLASGGLDPFRIQAVIPHRFGNGDVVPVSVVQVSGGEMSGQGAAADHAEREPGALLVRKGDDLDRMVGAYTTFLHRLHDLDAGENPERAVEVAAVVHGVDVGTNEDGWRVGITPLPAAEEVSDGVLTDREVALFHIRGDQVLGGPFFVGEREAGHAP